MALITTTKGEMEEAQLKKQIGRKDNAVETTDHVEYWLGGTKSCEHAYDIPAGTRGCAKGCGAELVHRSVNMKLKKAATFADAAVSNFK